MQRSNADDKVAVGPWLLALFIFVVCGSGGYFIGKWSMVDWCNIHQQIHFSSQPSPFSCVKYFSCSLSLLRCYYRKGLFTKRYTLCWDKDCVYRMCMISKPWCESEGWDKSPLCVHMGKAGVIAGVCACVCLSSCSHSHKDMLRLDLHYSSNPLQQKTNTFPVWGHRGQTKWWFYLPILLCLCVWSILYVHTEPGLHESWKCFGSGTFLNCVLTEPCQEKSASTRSGAEWLKTL